MTSTVGTDPPFTEDELRAARTQIAVHDCINALNAMVATWQAGIIEERKRLAALRARRAEELARRKQRVDAAERWLRGQQRPSVVDPS